MRAVPSRCQPALRISVSESTLARAGLEQRLPRPLDVEVEQPPRVLRRRVGDARRRRTPIASTSAGSSVTRLLGVGQVLAEDAPAQAVAEALAHARVMLGTPDGRAGARGHRRVHRPAGRGARLHLAPRTKPRLSSVS